MPPPDAMTFLAPPLTVVPEHIDAIIPDIEALQEHEREVCCCLIYPLSIAHVSQEVAVSLDPSALQPTPRAYPTRYDPYKSKALPKTGLSAPWFRHAQRENKFATMDTVVDFDSLANTLSGLSVAPSSPEDLDPSCPTICHGAFLGIVVVPPKAPLEALLNPVSVDEFAQATASAHDGETVAGPSVPVALVQAKPRSEPLHARHSSSSSSRSQKVSASTHKAAPPYAAPLTRTPSAKRRLVKAAISRRSSNSSMSSTSSVSSRWSSLSDWSQSSGSSRTSMDSMPETPFTAAPCLPHSQVTVPQKGQGHHEKEHNVQIASEDPEFGCDFMGDSIESWLRGVSASS